MIPLTTVLSTLGVGGLFGYGAGVAVRSVTRIVGCMIGVLFILMQMLAYYGFAEWHWGHIAEFVTGPGASAAGSLGAALWKILTYNLPFTGGFAAGFWLAMRR